MPGREGKRRLESGYMKFTENTRRKGKGSYRITLAIPETRVFLAPGVGPLVN